MIILVIALGGAVGASLRYGCSVAAQHLFDSLFPWGTFFVNIFGSLLLGFCATLFAELIIPREFRAFLLVGVFGSFTTFSTFMLESITLFRNKEYLTVILNLGGSIFLGLTCVFLGSLAARAILKQ